MSQKRADIPGVGSVLLRKRRQSRNLRLRLDSGGQVVISLPMWVPYGAGLAFVRSKQSWITEQRQKSPVFPIRTGDRIGKVHRVRFEVIEAMGADVTCRTNMTEIIVRTGLPFDTTKVQKRAREASERALKKQAQILLPQRVDSLAKKYNYTYSGLTIKKLTARWGSCSSKKHISLSLFLMQLPWHLIDYVILHELTHTEHLNHSQAFWTQLQKAYPLAKQARLQIKNHQTCITAINSG